MLGLVGIGFEVQIREKYTRIKVSMAVSACLLAGCASVTSGSSDTITVNSNPPGAVCNLSQNNRNIGQVVTPGGVTVEKTKHDIQVTCTKEGYQTATGYLDSEIEGSTWGNSLLGGGIGWAVDSASGSDNDYPDYITVTLVPNAAPVR